MKSFNKISPSKAGWRRYLLFGIAVAALYCLAVTGCSKENPVRLQIGLNYCAAIEYFTAMPITQQIDGSIQLSAKFSDGDSDSMRIKWFSFPFGNTFDNPYAAETRFNCRREGHYTIYFKVTDGECGETDHVEVTCVSAGGVGEDTGDETISTVDAGHDGGSACVNIDGGQQ